MNAKTYYKKANKVNLNNKIENVLHNDDSLRYSWYHINSNSDHQIMSKLKSSCLKIQKYQKIN